MTAARPSRPKKVGARYAVRQDDNGATVFDVWTGRPVVLGQERQCGLNQDAADRLAAILSTRAANGDRKVLQ